MPLRISLKIKLNFSWRIVVNITAWILLWILAPLVLNNSVNTTLKYYPKQALKEKTKIDGRDHEIFYEKAIGPRNI